MSEKAAPPPGLDGQFAKMQQKLAQRDASQKVTDVSKPVAVPAASPPQSPVFPVVMTALASIAPTIEDDEPWHPQPVQDVTPNGFGYAEEQDFLDMCMFISYVAECLRSVVVKAV